jgi:hypothetical protein
MDRRTKIKVSSWIDGGRIEEIGRREMKNQLAIVSLLTISSATASARAAICCGVWSWMGCCT